MCTYVCIYYIYVYIYIYTHTRIYNLRARGKGQKLAWQCDGHETQKVALRRFFWAIRRVMPWQRIAVCQQRAAARVRGVRSVKCEA